MNLRGDIALAKGDAVTAIADYRAVLRDNPEEGAVRRGLARAQFLNNELELARDNLRKAVQTQPNNIQWRLELAQLCAKADQPEEAIQELEELLKRSPDDACPLEALVWLRLRQRDLSRAVEIAERIKAKLPGKPLGHYVSGLIHQANGEWDASVHDFELALEKALGASQPLYKLLASDNRTRESNAVTLEQGVSTGPMMVIVMAHGCGCWLGQDMAGRGASRPSH